VNEFLNIAFDIKSLSAREFDGHAAVFRNVDLGGDIVLPRAFKRTIAEHKKDGGLPPMFWMHLPDRVPGKWLEMAEDDRGLKVHGLLAETDLGNEMHTLLKMEAVRGLSIGFRTRDVDFDADGNRLLKEVDLWEVSLVSLAMNPLAQVESVKSRLSKDGVYVQDRREFERFLRVNGYSRKFAENAISKIFNDPTFRGDPEEYRGDPGGDRDPDAQAVLSAAAGLTDKAMAASLHSLSGLFRS